MNSETVFRPVGELAKLIERTSLEDLCLFMIAASLKEQKAREEINWPIIGLND